MRDGGTRTQSRGRCILRRLDSLDGDDDHPSADSSLNVLDPDHLRVLQSYGLRPQVSYESSEEANSSDLDEASYEEAVNVSIREVSLFLFPYGQLD